MQKIIFSIICLCVFLTPALTMADQPITIYFFEAEGCPHCAAENAFLQKLILEDKTIEIKQFEISQNENNRQLLQNIADSLSITVSGVPLTFIGNQYFVGYQDEPTSGQLIKDLIAENKKNPQPDIVAPILNTFQKEQPTKTGLAIPSTINLPFWGALKTKNVSLPLLTIIIAAVDGFNPCSMWVLIFLIGLLLGLKNRKRMWILGISFLATSALVYFLFLAAWLNFFVFLGLIVWIRIAIAITAIVGGIYYLKRFFTQKTETCEISENEKNQKIFEKLKKITQKEQLWLALGGIILLAGMVNLVELMCSIGLPAIYTQVLSLSGLSPIQHYLYLLLYIIIFMADDMIVFVIAMMTLKSARLNQKYGRISALIGGIAMILVGLLLAFKPDWLMFG